MQKPIVTDPSVANRMDSLPITTQHVLLVVICGLGLAFDTFEIVLGSVLSAVFSAAPQRLPAGQLSLLLAAVYVGATVGAPALGCLADKRGRRYCLMGVLLWIALTSIAASQCQSTVQLIGLRFLSGIALGAYPPIMMAYLTDQLPPHHRGMLVFATSAVAMLGPPGVIFLVRALVSTRPLGLDAWRWGFIAGGTGAALVAVAFILLPESPRWLARRGQTLQAEEACRRFEQSRPVWTVRPEDSSPERKVSPEVVPAPAHVPTRWPALAALFLLSPWFTTAFPLLSGAVLAQKGFKLPDTLLYIGVATLGNIVGSAVVAPAIDRLDRRTALASFGLGMTVAVTAFMFSSSPAWLVGANVMFSLVASLYVPTLTLYGAELFPTSTRAAASSTGWALNRVGSAFSPLLLLPLLRSQGPLAMLAVIVTAWVASVIMLSFSPRGLQQRAVA